MAIPAHRRQLAAGEPKIDIGEKFYEDPSRKRQETYDGFNQSYDPVSSGYSAELDDAERASRDEITSLQTGAYGAHAGHAYDNVASLPKGVRQGRREAGSTPATGRPRQIPVHRQEGLRDNYPFNMFAVPREKLVRVHASSGTTGKPTVVGYTKADIESGPSLARSIRAAGGRTGMKMHNAYGYSLFTGGLGLHYGAEKLGVTGCRSRAA